MRAGRARSAAPSAAWALQRAPLSRGRRNWSGRVGVAGELVTDEAGNAISFGATNEPNFALESPVYTLHWPRSSGSNRPKVQVSALT